MTFGAPSSLRTGLLACCFILSRLTTSLDCGAPRPAFPVPQLDSRSEEVKGFAHAVGQSLFGLPAILGEDTAVSVEITTQSEPIFSYHHTPKRWMSQYANTLNIDSNTHYRAGELSQVVTALALGHLLSPGYRLRLEDTLIQHLPELHDVGKFLTWDEITLRTVLSQRSGLPHETLWNDIYERFLHHFAGFPPQDDQSLSHCGLSNPLFAKYCDVKDLLRSLEHRSMVFIPGQRTLASNTAFDLLGLMISRVSGTSFEEYMTTSIFPSLDMHESTFEQPSNNLSSGINESLWNISFGISNPSKGLYSTSSDLGALLRHMLTLQIPFDTLPFTKIDTPDLLDYTTRLITFYMKSSRLGNQSHTLIIMPEYNLGLVILTNGTESLRTQITDRIVPPLLRAADRWVQTDLGKRYTGIFDRPSACSIADAEVSSSSSKCITTCCVVAGSCSLSSLNSSILIAHSLPGSLLVHRWISNGTDMLDELAPLFGFQRHEDYRLHLTFTGLVHGSPNGESEQWRMVPRPWGADEESRPRDEQIRFSETYCRSYTDRYTHNGRAVDEVIFWKSNGAKGNGRIAAVEIPALQIVLERHIVSDGLGLFVQD